MRKVRIGTDVATMAEAVRQAYAEGQGDELFEPIGSWMQAGISPVRFGKGSA